MNLSLKVRFTENYLVNGLAANHYIFACRLTTHFNCILEKLLNLLQMDRKDMNEAIFCLNNTFGQVIIKAIIKYTIKDWLKPFFVKVD